MFFLGGGLEQIFRIHLLYIPGYSAISLLNFVKFRNCAILLVDSWNSALFFVLDLYYSFLDISNFGLLIFKIQAHGNVFDTFLSML